MTEVKLVIIACLLSIAAIEIVILGLKYKKIRKENQEYTSRILDTYGLWMIITMATISYMFDAQTNGKDILVDIMDIGNLEEAIHSNKPATFNMFLDNEKLLILEPFILQCIEESGYNIKNN